MSKSLKIKIKNIDCNKFDIIDLLNIQKLNAHPIDTFDIFKTEYVKLKLR